MTDASGDERPSEEPLESLLDLDDLEVPEESRAGSRANLVLYLTDIARIPALGEEPADDLARRAHAGDGQARDQLIRSCLRLVVQVARGYMNRGLPLLDLIEEGNVGLIEAVRRFDPTRSAHITPYMTWWIRQAIVSALATQSRRLGASAELHRLAEAHGRERQRLTDTLGRPPGTDELAEALGIRPDQVEALEDLQTGRPAVDGVEVLARLLRERSDLQGALDDLAVNERAVLRHRLGLEAPAKAAEAIAATLGLEPERVRQLEATGMRKLRTLLRARGVEETDLGGGP